MLIEQRIIEYLHGQLALPVYGEVPEGNEGRFLVVEKSGSSRSDYIDTATIVVQSYADSLAEAATLNNAAKTRMLAAPVLMDSISAVNLNSDYNYTDIDTKRYRYQGVFVVTYYE